MSKYGVFPGSYLPLNWIRENTKQKNFCIWAFFAHWYQCSETTSFFSEILNGKAGLRFNAAKITTENAFNPLSANPTKWSNTLKQLTAKADELFECVWPFYGVGAWKLNQNHFGVKRNHESDNIEKLLFWVSLQILGCCFNPFTGKTYIYLLQALFDFCHFKALSVLF